MRLAALGGRTVHELYEAMPASEIPLWVAFEGEYGLGDVHFLAARICTLVALLGGDKHAKPADFAPIFKRTGYHVMSPEAIKMALLSSVPSIIKSRKTHAPDQPSLSS